MISLKLITVLFALVQATSSPAEAPKAAPSPFVAANPAAISATLQTKLLKVTRIYIDDFGDDPPAKQIQAMVVNSISESKKFIITESKEKADAVLKGTALENAHQEFHSLNDAAAASTSHGSHHGEVSGTFVNGTGSVSGSSHGYHSGSAIAADDSTASTETINEARVAVRLVAADGDVIWSTTQESHGAKYKGASADVADKVIRQLMRDLERLQTTAPPNPPEKKK